MNYIYPTSCYNNTNCSYTYYAAHNTCFAYCTMDGLNLVYVLVIHIIHTLSQCQKLAWGSPHTNTCVLASLARLPRCKNNIHWAEMRFHQRSVYFYQRELDKQHTFGSKVFSYALYACIQTNIKIQSYTNLNLPYKSYCRAARARVCVCTYVNIHIIVVAHNE